MFFGALKDTSKKTPALIFDIGGASVGAALVILSSNDKPYIIHTAREWLRPVEETSMARLIGLLETAIDSVSEDIRSLGARRLAASGHGDRLPQSIDCFVTAPWYAPQVNAVRILGGKPFKVTHALLLRAIDGEKRSIEKRFGIVNAANIPEDSSVTKTGPGASTVSVIEQQVLSLAINGYAAEKPCGQNANEAEFLLYTAFAEERPLACFNARMRRTFHMENARMRSFLPAFFSAIRDSREAEEDFLLLDVSGEITELSVVRGGELSATVSFPLGRNFLARALARECSVSFEEALSILSVYFSKQCNDSLSSRLCAAVNHVEGEWMRHFEEGLAHIARESFLPHSIFVAADKKISPWVSEMVQNEALYQYTLTEKPFVINLADEKAFGAHVAFGPGVAKDSFLMIDAMFLNKIKV